MRKLLSLLLVLSIPSVLHAQRAIHLGVSDGLSSSLVNTLYQDGQGDIWIATENGLNRYDGLYIHSYKNNPADIHSLAHNVVRSFAEDGEGRLFVGSQGGVQYYDREKDFFSPPLADLNGERYSGNVDNLLRFDDHTVWVSGNALMKIIRADDGSLALAPLRLPIPTQMMGEMKQDSESGSVWVARFGDGIYRVDSGGVSSHYLPDVLEGPYAAISNVVEGRIYAADNSGHVCHFDPVSATFVKDESAILRGARVRDILYLDDGKVVFALDGQGTCALDAANGNWMRFEAEDFSCDPETMSVHGILQDRDGNLWLAVYQYGVMMLPAQRNGFGYLGARSFRSDVIGSHPVSSLQVGPRGKLWIGTQNDGIYLLDEDKTLLKHFPVSLGFPDTIFGLTMDRHHNLWFGSFTDGLWKLEPDKDTPVRIRASSGRDISGDSPYGIVEDGAGRIWIGTMGSGLYYYDPARRDIIFPDFPADTYNPWITDLLLMGENLYAATYDGLYEFNVSTALPTVRRHTLDGTVIYSLVSSDGEKIYACTDGGLAIISRTDLETTLLTTADGLPDNAVYNVCPDVDGSLWLTTGASLCHFFPETGKSVSFWPGDGLMVSEFCRKTSAVGPDNRFYFGGIDGIVHFKPEEICAPSGDIHVKIVSIRSPNHYIPLSKEGSYTLSYPENACTVSFTTEEFISPEGLHFCYSLNGKIWSTLAQGQTSMMLGDLRAGTYKLHVKAVRQDMESAPVIVSLRVRPSVFGSPLAICGYVVLALLLCGILYSLLRRHELDKKVLRHYEREQREKEDKMKFFLSLSHEIRSPMTLVQAPLQKLMETDSDPVRQRSYAIIQRNANTVLHIVNQTLAIGKADDGALQLSFSPVALVNYVSAICELYQPQAEHNGQKLTFRYACAKDLEVWLDREYFDKVIANLLSNALKYTPSGGAIGVTVSSDATQATVEVKDNGTGMSDDAMQKAFDLFYQGPGAVSGTGLGLNFAKKITELHHGTIRAQHNPEGPGTVFLVSLPLGNVHLRDGQMAPRSTPALPLSIPGPQPVSEIPKDVHARRRHKLLLADDNVEIRQWLESELSVSYKVLEAEDGKRAWSLILSERPDLVIIDVVMPGMDGFELCERIRKHPDISTLPVILLTARTMDRDKIEGMEAGADAYITKPFSIDVLKKTVSNLLRGRERLRISLSESKVQDSDIRDPELETPDDRLLARVVRVVNDNLDNPELTVEQVAEEVGISRVHLHRKLKELTGQTSRDFIRNIRLKKAAELLAVKKYAISELSDAVGFQNSTSFSSAFKMLFGVSPTEYSQQHMQKPES